MSPQIAPPARRAARRKLLRTAVAVIALLVMVSAGYGLLGEPGPGTAAESIPTVAVARGDFTVSVTERGAVYSMESLEIKSEVESWNLLSEVVDEGTVITEKDVEEGMILARLDSSTLEEQESDMLIGLYGAEAAYAQARENYEIQEKQNESDMAVAELNVEFAHMEFKRYLGADLAAQVLEERMDFANLADDTRLGGTARQTVSTYTGWVELASEGLLRAQERLRWTSQLHEKEYASRNEVTEDELSVTRAKFQLDANEEALDVLKRYTLPKEAEQRYSDCEELERELERVEARASSRLTQAEAQLRSSEATYELQKERLDKVRDNIKKCTMEAPQPGQVVYGSRSDPIWYRTGDSAVRPGVWIEENRTIVRIPDPSSLAALVNIPEGDIRKVEVGQPALIALEAVPDRTFAGRVAKVSPIASSAQTQVNIEAKVYGTEVALEGSPEHFMPGMSATVKIIAARLKDVLYVPGQAVTRYKDYSICWVKGADGPEPRTVETGHRSDIFMEITSGLNAGEQVYLAPPREIEEEVMKGAYQAPDS